MAKKNSFNWTSGSALETKRAGEALANWLIKNRPTAAIFLSGDLGAGKTIFTKGLAKGLGIKRPILSPSFVLLRSYRGRAGWQLHHIDAYRLSPAEAKIFDWKKLAEPKTVTVVEWPEKISESLPKKSLRIKITHQTPRTRILELPVIIQTHVTRFINRRQ